MTPTEIIDYLATWSRGQLLTTDWPLQSPVRPPIRTWVDVWATALGWHQAGRIIIPVASGSRPPPMRRDLGLADAQIAHDAAAYLLGDRVIALARVPSGHRIAVSADRDLCISQRGPVLTYLATDGVAVDAGYVSLADQPTPAHLRLLSGVSEGELYDSPLSEDQLGNIGLMLAQIIPRFYAPPTPQPPT